MNSIVYKHYLVRSKWWRCDENDALAKDVQAKYMLYMHTVYPKNSLYYSSKCVNPKIGEHTWSESKGGEMHSKKKRHWLCLKSLSENPATMSRNKLNQHNWNDLNHLHMTFYYMYFSLPEPFADISSTLLLCVRRHALRRDLLL